MGRPGITTRPVATKFSGQRCMDDLEIERSFDLQAKWAIDVLGFFLTCYPWVSVQPGTGRRPVDWCRNQISVLYLLLSVHV